MNGKGLSRKSYKKFVQIEKQVQKFWDGQPGTTDLLKRKKRKSKKKPKIDMKGSGIRIQFKLGDKR